jgi:hypothetical protein
MRTSKMVDFSKLNYGDKISESFPIYGKIVNVDDEDEAKKVLSKCFNIVKKNDGMLFHLTYLSNLDSIKKHGLLSNTDKVHGGEQYVYLFLPNRLNSSLPLFPGIEALDQIMLKCTVNLKDLDKSKLILDPEFYLNDSEWDLTDMGAILCYSDSIQPGLITFSKVKLTRDKFSYYATDI